MRVLCLLIALVLPPPAVSQTLADVEKQADEAFAQAYLVCSIHQGMVEECSKHRASLHRIHNRGDLVPEPKPKISADQCDLYLEEKKGLGEDCKTFLNDPAGAYQSLVQDLLLASKNKSTKR